MPTHGRCCCSRPIPSPGLAEGRQSPAERGTREDGAQFAVWSTNPPVWHEGRDGQGALGAKEGNGRIEPTELPCCCSLPPPLSSSAARSSRWMCMADATQAGWKRGVSAESNLLGNPAARFSFICLLLNAFLKAKVHKAAKLLTCVPGRYPANAAFFHVLLGSAPLMFI